MNPDDTGGASNSVHGPSTTTYTEEVTVSLKIARLYVLSLLVVLAVGPMWAQDQAQQAPAEHPKHHMMGASQVTATGCLQKGDEADEYSITGEDGKKYGLRSSKVKLSEHVGHKVTITGKKQKQTAKEKKEPGAEAADLTVSKLEMVSETCP
jgi:hypothetical protein